MSAKVLVIKGFRAQIAALLPQLAEVSSRFEKVLILEEKVEEPSVPICTLQSNANLPPAGLKPKPFRHIGKKYLLRGTKITNRLHRKKGGR